jgi:hypothetical protein
MGSTHELAHETWAEYFDATSRELLNAPVSIEQEASRWPQQEEVRRLALQLLTYDRSNDVFEIAATRSGPDVPGVVRHTVEHPRRVIVDSSTLLPPMTIAVDNRDGVRTVVRIDRPAASFSHTP